MPWILPTILKNLFSTPATRRYPYVKRETFSGARGKIYWDAGKCDLCGDCARVCPGNAIQVDVENRQIEYNPLKCIYCGTCVETCLQHAITQDKYYAPPSIHKKKETTAISHSKY